MFDCPGGKQRFSQANGRSHFSDIVNANNARPSFDADDGAGRGSSQPLSFIVAPGGDESFIQRAFDEGFPRSSEQDRQAEFSHQTIQTIDKLKILPGSFAEADARIENYSQLRNTALPGLFDGPAQTTDDFGKNVFGKGQFLHGFGCAAQMHQHQTRAGFRRQIRQPRIESQSTDVVDDFRAALNRAARDLQFGGIN